MRLLRLAIPVALLSLVVACGSSTTTTPPAAAPTSAPATSSGPTGSSEPSSATGSVQVLTGLVGSAANPEAFEITLKDATGADVTTLKAGTYQVKVKDASAIHNFHLTGTGVEQTTGPVATLADPTWSITLTAGTYTYKCDPHPNMVKTFTVT
jgi:plastocyanin